MNDHIGIIDIGSNSIRLVVYEQTENGAHRVIDESKESARLSEKIDTEGRIEPEGVAKISETLSHFRLLCETHRVRSIRAVATAAIRNAVNGAQVLTQLQEESGICIDIISGEDEARYGFLGMINTIDIDDGFLVDIGGGSTEVSLFRDRALVRSVSFPFGAVNTTKHYSRGGNVTETDVQRIRTLVETAVASEPWIREYPGLTLVGLGGTIRNVAKIDQKVKKYSLQHAHNYEMDPADVDKLLTELAALNVEQRKRYEGLSKERADIIVPGMAILKTIFELTGSERYLISGSGLRDGLFYETVLPEQPLLTDVLEYSVRNLLLLHPSVPIGHVEHVNRLALGMFDDLEELHGLGGRSRLLLHAASLLYRIGISVNYYDYYKHTFYLMAHSRLNGLSHREIVICSLVAAFKTEKKTRLMAAPYRDILAESDLQLAVKLGSLLQLAASLDRSETQPIQRLEARIMKRDLKLLLNCRRQPEAELRQLHAIQRDFEKIWGLQIQLHLIHS